MNKDFATSIDTTHHHWSLRRVFSFVSPGNFTFQDHVRWVNVEEARTFGQQEHSSTSKKTLKQEQKPVVIVEQAWSPVIALKSLCEHG